MDITDCELREQLKNDPIVGGGFDEKLKNRILKRIDDPSPRKRRMLWWSAPVVAVVLLAVIVLLWDLSAVTVQEHSAENLSSPHLQSTEEMQTFVSDRERSPSFASAMLIGLKNDREYRTILIAPERGELQQMAEGQGIVMPFESEFWKLAPMLDDDGVRIAAEPIVTDLSGAEPMTIAGLDVSELDEKRLSVNVFEESLLFAGNRYITVEINYYDEGKSQLAHRQYRVREIGRYGGDRHQPGVYDPLIASHVRMSELQNQYGEIAPPVGERTDRSWAIVRKAGNWIIVSEDGEILVDGPLPEPLVSHDELALTWDEITANWPDALDAFTSPAEEIIAVQFADRMEFYPLYETADSDSRLEPGDQPVLMLSLDTDDQIVMVQWAIAPYVEQWKQKLSDIWSND